MSDSWPTIVQLPPLHLLLSLFFFITHFFLAVVVIVVAVAIGTNLLLSANG